MDEGRPDLWLIRHGETEWSRSGRHTGRTDIPLTETGEHQATALGRHVGSRSFALVLTSPLSRARETCRLAGFAGVATVSEDLHEWDYGQYEGRTTEDIRAEVPGWSIWTGAVPGGETIEQVGGRAGRVIDRALGARGDVLLFAHGHILRILAACWLGLPPGGGRLFSLGTASLSVLGHEREGRVLRTWNQDWHLARQENT